MNLRNLSLVCLITLSFFSCKKEINNKESLTANKPVPGYNCANYNVSLAVAHENGNTIFTWTVTNPNPGNGSGTTLQDLSHWDFVPSTCLDQNWQDVISASYNTGSGWVAITPLPDIEPDPSLKKDGCYGADVFKFDQGTSGKTPTMYQMVLDGNWGTGDLHAYFKSGTNTGCCDKVIANAGIGCPVEEECSFSQGYWFANNAAHPDGVHPWNQTVTIGGYTYTNAEGLAIWNASNAGGIKDAKKAFTQLAAIKLSGIDANAAGLTAAVTTIESWLANYGAKLTAANLRNQTANEITLYGNAKAAADAISAWINANHCQ